MLSSHAMNVPLSFIILFAKVTKLFLKWKCIFFSITGIQKYWSLTYEKFGIVVHRKVWLKVPSPPLQFTQFNQKKKKILKKVKPLQYVDLR